MWTFVVTLLGIVWMDLMLSGDNAVVIALKVRGLPVDQQKIGMFLGVGVAILLRIAGLFLAALLLMVPGFRLVGGLFLLYVIYGMITEEQEEEKGEVVRSNLVWVAIQVGLADAVMSMDNVVAIAALAKGNFWLMVFGVILSIPFVVLGAAMIKWVVDKFPWLVYAAAGFLLWVAFDIAKDDSIIPMIRHWINS